MGCEPFEEEESNTTSVRRLRAIGGDREVDCDRGSVAIWILD